MHVLIGFFVGVFFGFVSFHFMGGGRGEIIIAMEVHVCYWKEPWSGPSEMLVKVSVFTQVFAKEKLVFSQECVSNY